MSRILLGAIAGICGTTLMTATMRALHRELDAGARYPLPPREITESVLPRSTSETRLRTTTTAAHFAYGAAMGSLMAMAPRAITAAAGAGYGLLIWAASYLGWIPAMGILKSAVHHQFRRNALMAGAHLAWGMGTSLMLRELSLAERRISLAASCTTHGSPSASRQARPPKQAPDDDIGYPPRALA